MCMNANMLYGIGAIEMVSKFDGLRLEWIVYMNIEVTGNDEVVGVVAALERKDEN